MNEATYTVLALAARYFFALLGVLIAFRAWRITVVDNRRAKILRDWMPQTGQIGDFIVLRGTKQLKKGARIAIMREGFLGTSRRADIFVREPGIEKKHFTFEQRTDGLLITPAPGAQVMIGEGEEMRAVTQPTLIHDGEEIAIRPLRLMLVLFDIAAEEGVPEPLSPVARRLKKRPPDEFEGIWDDVAPEEDPQNLFDPAAEADNNFDSEDFDKWQAKKRPARAKRR